MRGIKFIYKKGQWYAGTNDYLIEFDENSTDYYKWNEFENIYTVIRNKDSMDIILTLKKPNMDISLETDVEKNVSITNINNISISLNGKQVDISQMQKKHSLFMNKIGLIGIKNGELVFNMIKHNMERGQKVNQYNHG